MAMLHRQLFIDAIENALGDTDYRLVGDSFYLYRPERGLVIKLSFDVLSGGSDFYIYGGAAAFCDKIEIWPDGQLSISGCDVSTYASCCGLPTFSNMNIDTANILLARRYTKAQLSRGIARNIDVFKKTLMPELLHMEGMEDYFNFKVKADGFRYYVPIPFPGINAFYLCLQLGKFREASHVCLMMLQRDAENVRAICKNMLPDVINALGNTETPEIHSNANTFERLDAQAKSIESVLNARQDDLKVVLRQRIDYSRTVCEKFFG